MDQSKNKAIEVFFSYAHEDEAFRDQLANHLKVLERNGTISAWHDREIAAGEEWKPEILKQLNQADIILLLISSDFLASDFCWGIELERAMERHENCEAKVIPIIVRAVDWKNSPFGKLQALPKNAEPVDNWLKADQAYEDIAKGIRKIVEQLKKDEESGLNNKVAPNPDNLQMDPDAIKRIVREELGQPRSEYSQSVNLGFNALVELMKASQVRDAVVAFQVDFDAACEQIHVIADYKAIHDLLHKLEFQCYKVLIEEVRRSPDIELILDSLFNHELTLDQVVGELQDISIRETLALNEKGWLKDLKQAQAELHGAVEELDSSKLKKTIWILNRILAIHPSRVNTNLNSAARALRLPTLVNAMKSIWKQLSGANLDSEKFSQFQHGVEALAALEERLSALVISHDYWQEIDLELRRIDGNLEQDLTDLEMSWPEIKEKTAILFDSSADQWTKDLHQDGDNLDAAIAASNPAKIKSFFRVYRRRASNRFYQIDVALKRLCEELRKVGEPLASVLRMVE